MLLTIGEKLGPYEIVAPAGAGGMGEVYRAVDTRLQRTVAIKLVRRELAERTNFRERFRREARAISALNHPHICSLYDIGEQKDFEYLVMEFVDGESLTEVLKKGPLSVERAVQYATEIAGALAAAHARNIIHRDLKPGNIMITRTGVKVLDFGLAKRIDSAPDDGPTAVTVEAQTSAGQRLGTVAYMSPEQAEGKPADVRSDLFAFGVVLYEMLSGRRPFRGDSTIATLASILREEPPSLQMRQEIPPGLEKIVFRCLAKNPDARYSSADDLLRDIERLHQAAARGLVLRKPFVAAAGLVMLAVLGLAGVRWYRHYSQVRWAETQAIPQAARLVDSLRPLAALTLLRQTEAYAPASPELIRLKEDIHLLTGPVETTPPGAEIYITDYSDPQANELSHWEHLGRSPLKGVTLPVAYYRIRAEKSGYEPVEAAWAAPLELHTKAETPAGMVWIPAAPPLALFVTGIQLPRASISAAWIDKYEVTNRQFKEFVDAGAYQKHEYWKEAFVKDGKEIPWEEAIAGFRDATGRPGPSTWEAGTYPDGKADFPVGGVSWYEADAYAEFAGKSLPSVYHWYIAAGFGPSSQITALSNFRGQGPTRVGATTGVTSVGAYDMAGNLKEWTRNPTGEKRYILGGSWNESSYMFGQSDARSPFERDSTFGFRCLRYVGPVPEALLGPVVRTSMYRDEKPVDDRTFDVFKSLLTYDKSDLKARLESTSDAPHWRMEKVSFQAGYGNERVIVHLYLPKEAAPPYQAVMYFGGANMLQARTPEEVSTRLMEYIVKSGRAVALPAYAGTLERGPSPVLGASPSQRRDLIIMTTKDVSRTLDYLETRKDIDSSKFAYHGLSIGSSAGLVALAVEPRFKTAILASAGTTPKNLPEADSWNYVPRIKLPVLMVNGHDDSLLPVESSQIPLFKALGTPDKDKKHSIYPGGHVDYLDRMEVIKEALNWLDRYLGPVTSKP
jgi:dienelactone hydrolase